jgi:HlyD family secretion protein
MSSTDEGTPAPPEVVQDERRNRLAKPALLVALTGLLMLGVFTLLRLDPQARNGATATAASAAAPTALPWIAAAPGRIEPRTGEIRVGTPILGRIADVHVRTNDEVNEGELLVRLDDEEVRARLSAAEAEAGARKRERDAQPATAGRDDVRKAEDAAYTSERLVSAARNELDNLVNAIRNGTAGNEKFADVRKKLTDARDRLARDRTTLLNAQARANLPAPNRFESSLTAGRADVSAADALLEKTRLRAPLSGRVLQLQAKVGETVAPAPDQPLVVLGDMSVIRVKAEVDERDVGKLKVGQSAFVRTDAFAAQSFEGRISAVASSLGPPRIGQRGPRRPTDVEVLEVTIDLVGQSPLLPGMRVDAFFRKAEEAAKPAEPVKPVDPVKPAEKAADKPADKSADAAPPTARP